MPRARTLAGFLLVIFVSTLATSRAFSDTPHAQTAVYLVRHAERAAGGGDDPPLAAEGKQRARDLQRVLRSIPLKQIYVTKFKRTQQTAAPTAEATGLVATIENDVAALASKIKNAGTPQAMLVVGHSDTVPELIKKLGVHETVDLNDEYDNLFILVLAKDGTATLQHLHYGK